MKLLNRLLKSRLQPSEAAPRRPGRKTLILPTNQPRLAEIARRHDDPDVRRAALERIRDPALAAELIRSADDEGRRSQARQHRQALLAGKYPDGPPLGQRLQALAAAADDTELALFLCREGDQPALRLAALTRLDRQALYAERAVADPAAELRLQALAAVQDATLLEHIVQQTRKRDKTIHRGARERLQQRYQALDQRRRIDELCQSLEGLRWDGETGAAAARFARLQQQWRELPDDAVSAADHERFQRAETAFENTRQQHLQRRRQREQLCQRLQTLIDAEPGEDLTALIRRIEQTRVEVTAAWRPLASEVQDPDSRRLEQRYRELDERLRGLGSELGERRRQQRRQQQAQRKLRESAERLLRRSGRIDPAEIETLQRRWRQKLASSDSGSEAAARAELDRLSAQLEARLLRQEQLAAEEQRTLEDLLQRLEQALAGGQLKPAEEADKQLREHLDSNISLQAQQIAAARERLRACTESLHTLRDWQRWGSDRAREQLCQQIESLAAQLAGAEAEGAADSADDKTAAADDRPRPQTPNPTELARQVREARAAWQRLDRSGKAASRGLWQRFDRACEQVYRPAQQHFEAEAARRRAHLQQRQQLCAEIEHYIAEIDRQQNPDWPAVARFLAAQPPRWRRLGPVDRGDRKPLERRFTTALEALQTRLQPPQQQEINRRKALIRRVETLAEDEDLGQAVETVKQLQQDWQPRLSLPRRQEQALWQAFRAACDAVFERRQHQRRARDSERQRLLERKTVLCAEVEQLAALEGDALLGAQNRLQTLRQSWEALDSELPKKTRQSVEQRFQQALDRFQQRVAGHRRQAERAALDEQREYAAWCRRLEAALDPAANAGATAEDVATLLAEAEALWRDAVADEALAARYHAARAALQAPPDDPGRTALIARLKDNLEEKLTLCLRMEIASGAETPDAHVEQRMRYQVARLSTAMTASGGRENAAADEDRDLAALERRWHALGVLPAERAAALERRFRRVLAVADLGGHGQTPSVAD